jgi:hypothetical protein
MAWFLLEAPTSVDLLASRLASIYGVETHLVSSQVHALVEDLLGRGWLKEAVHHGE